MTAPTKPANFYADFGGLATLKGAAKNQDPKALRETARQFESLFTQMMLKSMRQASLSGEGGDKLMDSDQSNFYRDMFDNQMATQLSKGKGLGLADMLVRQMSQGQLTSSSEPSAGKNVATKIAALTMPSRSASAQSATSAAPPTSTTNGAMPSAIELQYAVDAAKPLSKVEMQNMINAIVGGSDANNSSSEPVSPPDDVAIENRAIAFDNSASATKPAAPSIVRPQPLASSREEFIRKMMPHAQAAARELGVDAKTLIAHAALETGWGKFIPCNPDGSCSFNLFGIKATSQWKGDAVAVNTLEFSNGIAVKKLASFRAYDSPAESFRDYAALIKNSPRYASAIGTGDNATAFASALQQGGYATDPQYAAKLTAVADKLGSTLKPDVSQPLAFGRSVLAGKVSGEAT